MINNIGQMQSTLKSYDAKGWSKSVELGNRVDFNYKPEVGNDGSAKTFGDFLVDSMSQVNDLQAQANQSMEQLASGKSNNLHETLLAVEKADIAFKTMNQVRMKVIDAYREIMKMQI